jgi:hypothetical protein
MDEVHDASVDSFPASDPPVWSSMHAGPPVQSEVDSAKELKRKTTSLQRAAF